jgi:hypothetical protein
VMVNKSLSIGTYEAVAQSVEQRTFNPSAASKSLRFPEVFAFRTPPEFPRFRAVFDQFCTHSVPAAWPNIVDVAIGSMWLENRRFVVGFLGKSRWRATLFVTSVG